MAESPPLHKALASDDPFERRDGLLHLSFLLGDRISQLESVKREVDLAVRQMNRIQSRQEPDGRRVLKSRHLKSAEEQIRSIEELVAGHPGD